MAVSGFSFLIPFAIGPLLAGVVLDTMDPRLLWYFSGLVGMLSVMGFLWLHRRTDKVRVKLGEGEALSG
jgi:MFS family permease